MRYIINLSRFVSINEKKEIMQEMKRQGIDVKPDPWSSLRLITDRPIFNKPYISNIIELKETFFPKTISETIEHLKKYDVKDINTKIWDNVPFHRKAIVDRFLKKAKFKKTGKTIYIEAKPGTNRPEPEVRLGIVLVQREPILLDNRTNVKVSTKEKQLLTKNNNISLYPDLLIESPKTIGEISDFVRLSKTFKMKVFISTLNDPDCTRAIAEFKNLSSFEKANVEIIQFSDDLKKEYTLVGFSLWGKDNLSSLNNLKTDSKKLLFLFGNEKRGLKKNTMDMCDKVVKIGENSSEPLRATQAAAFGLGYIFKR